MTDRDVAQIEAIMRLLIESGDMTPMAAMQIRKVWTVGKQSQEERLFKPSH